MNVSLTPQMVKFVEEQVASGDYQSASEVVRSGLRLLHERRKTARPGLERPSARKSPSDSSNSTAANSFDSMEEVLPRTAPSVTAAWRQSA